VSRRDRTKYRIAAHYRLGPVTRRSDLGSDRSKGITTLPASPCRPGRPAGHVQGPLTSGSRHYVFARQMANPRMMIGTSTSHAAASITINGASIGDPSPTTSIRPRHAGLDVLDRIVAQFKQPVPLDPFARLRLRCEAGCCPDHCTELAQGDAVTTILADEHMISWWGHALHMAWHRARYMPRLHKLSCSTDNWSDGH
jgi:hypothetical protein